MSQGTGGCIDSKRSELSNDRVASRIHRRRESPIREAGSSHPTRHERTFMMLGYLPVRHGLIPALCLLSILTGGWPLAAQAELPTTAPWELERLRQPPHVNWLDQESPIRSLTYQNEPYQGHTSEVFAFYATPGSVSGDPSRDRDLPAVVLIHGGGGTAFAEWVWLWAQRGYAAIAMDLSGRRPDAPRFDDDGQLVVVRNHRLIERTRLQHGGPEQGGQEKFQNAGGDLTDDWQLHAVAAVIRAHSLIRSRPEVDAERTAVTGISWGGYLTCLVASLDDRFQAAVPVYGCGFLHEGESVQKPLIDRLDESTRKDWLRMYEPSVWLPRCRVPILFVNGTNDVHYPLNSYRRSFELVPGERQIRIEVNMRHSHPAGWAPAEIEWFVAQHINGGRPLPRVSALDIQAGVARVRASAAAGLKSAQLHYTADDGLLSKREWISAPLKIDEQGAIQAKIPREARIWLIGVTDSRDAMVSTPPVFQNSPAGESKLSDSEQ